MASTQNTPKTPSPPKITADPEATLAAFRRQQAGARENQLAYQEVEAKRWEKVAALSPTTHGAPAQRKQFVDTRDRHRVETKKMHELAGTTREAFKFEVLNTLESMRFGFEQQYLGAVDALQNPAAYGPQGPYGNNTDPIIWTMALEALDEVIEEVKAWPDPSPGAAE